MTDTTQQFFISYAGVDRPWAEWVGWHLERSGHRVTLDVWDWRTGDDFVQRMDQALEQADAVVTLFSKAYFEEGRWTQEEWSAAVAGRDRIIPLTVEPVTGAEIPPLLAPRIRKDLHGLEETAAVAALLEAVNGGRRPSDPPAYPGAAPAVPDEHGASDEPVVPEGPKPRLPGSTERPEVWHVGPANRDFSGREAEIVQLREGLLRGRHSAVYALHGMGGCGKTQIALEYAHRFADQYDLVWWIDAEQSDQIPVHYTELADRAGIAVAEAGAEHNARTLLQHLRKRSRWLIIFDNAEDPDQIEPWLPEGPGHVLITSRNPNWRRLAQPTALDVFTRADSLAYLRSRIQGIAEEQTELLAKDLGDLPLALAQAAGVIENGMTVDRYRRLLTESTGRILREGEAPGYTASLEAAVSIAAARLDDEHPDSAALLRLAAFLGPEPIPTEWLEKARPRLSTIPGDPHDLMWSQAALEPLRRYGLARIDGESLQIHRLTQAVLRDHVDPAQRQAIHDDAAAVLAAVTPGDPQSPVSWPVWATLTSHLTAQHIDVRKRTELRATLLDAVHFLIRSGQPRSSAELAADLRTAWTSQTGPDDPDVLTCTQYLGHATTDIGDLRGARPIIEDAFSRRRRTLGDDHPDTLKSANDLGAILGGLGEYAESHRMDEDTFGRRRRLLGEDHPDTLQSASNLAASLHAMGRFAEALRMAEDTLDRRRRVLGEDHPDTLHSAGNLAGSLAELGRLSEARHRLRDVVTRCRTALGDDDFTTLTAANRLASTLYALNEFEEARRLHEDTLARRRRLLGDDHPDTLTSAHNLASTLYALGEGDEARRLHEDTLARRRRLLGDDHPGTIGSVSHLAAALREEGQYAQAHVMEEDGLARCRRLLGDDHPATLRSTRNLAITLLGLRNHREAARLLEDTRARQLRIFGVDHPDTRSTTQSLAEVYTAMGKKFKAQQLLAKKPPKRRFNRKSR
ncbi:FxSxx-COOH system tetratricopeptide repeat protein [Streptomyces sp. MMG1533]|uniref:FxSxx-COOH system tetratricopeptide repeat protein n=1 Tax=Streptomyces sp. MMG1533 TaxID=1415546 RepID=UPI0006AECDF2|nr:FxSxx-COOH system tetratricopeptide repeat protein [Streptomyces sp. MMG1533]